MVRKKNALKLIEQAAKEGWTELSLVGLGLTNVPPEITELSELTSLDLTGNELRSLPPNISKLINLTYLDLEYNQLTTLPPEIVRLRKLTGLILSYNQLTSFPTEITKLTNLTSLELVNNRLTSLPPAIGKLTRLTNLGLASTRLKDLPPEIAKLIRLTSLDLSNNELTRLPPVILKLPKLTSLNLGHTQLKSLSPKIAQLTNLTSLDLQGNQLSSLPPEIAKLTNLTSLDLSFNQFIKVPQQIFRLTELNSLNLWNNQLTSLPRMIGKLSRLTSLILRGNQLTDLPPEITELRNLTELNLAETELRKVWPEVTKLTNLSKLVLGRIHMRSVPREIAKLTNLTELYLWNNQIKTLPSEITKLKRLSVLDLQGNSLTSLPPDITQLTKLTQFELEGNQLPIPPETFADPGNVKAIFAAIAGLKSGERLNEAKMLVVGDGKVGKSSVVEQLIHGTFNPRKQTTLGIEINDEMKVVESEVKGEGESIKLNIWDFGGQEIQHSTHQFFLTTRSLYLLVVDARKGNQLDNIEYWLKLIGSFGGDSPIIIVINQIDQLKGQRALNLDRRALQQKYNIRNFVETSCETGQGIPKLKIAITREVEQLKHVHDIWPREWLSIKQRLKEVHADYIPVEKYLEICDEEKLDDRDLRQSLLGLLHDLGVIIRFPGDMQVLNPRWVTQGVYGLLTSPELVKSQGQFDLKDVGKILAVMPEGEKRYPSYTHRRLIDVMRHFELCFEFTDRPDHYLIPRHLHDNESTIAWDDADTLKFQYHYDTLPDSIISRFIVRMSRFITEQHYWKTGVFLQNSDDNNVAKIKADLVDRIIFISINGKENTKRAFLAVIRSALDEINSFFKIEIEQRIPVPGFPDVLVSYEELLAHEEMRVSEIVIAKLRRKFPVGELLDGVEELSVRVERREGELSEEKGRKSSTPMQPRVQRLLRVVAASPSDVQAERDMLPDILEEVNRYIVERGLTLVLTRWETDTHPGFHPEGPQGLIDPILKITDCELLIGIFWKRFGTQTVGGKTGTEHEFNQAHQAWKEKGSPQIFAYFSDKAYTPKSKAEAEQWGQVLEFKEKFPKEGLWWQYRGKAQFEKLVRNHLMNYVRTLN